MSEIEPESSECDSCRYPGAELKEFRMDDGRGTMRLCDLCAGTMAGSWHEYRHQHDNESLEILRTICFVGNSILDALRGT